MLLRKLRARTFAIIVALAPLGAFAQQFPVVPDHSVLGRIGTGTGSGPAQAIPFSAFLPNIVGSQAPNLVFAGPIAAPNATPSFRALVGSDLPTPGASSLGGVQSKACSTSNWFNTLSTGGILGCSQPGFADLTGTISAAQCVAATGSTLGCVKPDGTTITISGGVITAQGTATSVDAAGATSVTNCGTANAGIYNTSGNKIACAPGQWQLLNTLTASNSPTLSDTTHFTSAYNEYEIEFINLLPATTSISCEIQFQVSGSFVSTGYITSFIVYAGSAPTGISPTTYIPCSNTGSAINSGPGISGSFRIPTPSQSTFHSLFGQAIAPQGSGVGAINGAGYLNSGSVVTGFQVIPSSGNWTSGQIKIYGRI